MAFQTLTCDAISVPQLVRLILRVAKMLRSGDERSGAELFIEDGRLKAGVTTFRRGA